MSKSVGLVKFSNNIIKMNWNSLHLIKGDDINVAYHCSSYNITMINNRAFEILELLKSGLSVQEVAERSGRDRNEICSFIQLIEKQQNISLEDKGSDSDGKQSIDRITLHVSNDCNLRCKYCFAEGGNYKQAREIMTVQTAKVFVDFCIDTFDRIEHIVFFGGEPMFNVDVMEFICNQFETYYKTGKSSFLPRFCIITNGTILTSKIVQLIKEHISLITVSVDGPEEINDINRIDKNGKGSYTKIAKFIRTIQKETNVKIQYEATFTQSHIDAFYSRKDISVMLRNEFGIDGFVVNDMELPISFNIDCLKYINLDDLIETDFVDMPSDFWVILNAIVNKESRTLCPIGKSIFAVGTDGFLYPCHLLNGVEKRRLGNINGKHIFNTPTLSSSFFSKVPLKECEKCKKCWAQGLCGGCTLEKFYDKETEELTVEPKAEACEATKLYLEKILLLIAIVRNNPDLWAALIEKQEKCNFS